MNGMVQMALSLLDHGYVPLGVNLESKAARNPGWSVETPTEQTVRRTFARPSNIGVRCGDIHQDGTCLVAIDIDIDEHELVRCVQRAIGDAANVPVKRGKKGATYLIRIDQEQKTTKIYWSRGGKKVAAVDILGKGAQTVIPPSIHADTKLPYRWVAGPPLDEVDFRSLPVFGASVIDEIRGFCKDPEDPIYALNDMEWRGVGGGGNTHDTCVRAVASMVARQWEDEDIHRRIDRAKREACDAAGAAFHWPDGPKSVDEWIKSARDKKFDAADTRQGRPGQPARLSHGVVADAIFPQVADVFRYDRDRQSWYFFDGVQWGHQRNFMLRRAIDLFLSPELRNTQMITGIERSLRDRPEFTTRQVDWDPDPHLLNTPDGTVELKTGRLRPAAASDLITRCTSVSPAESYEGSLWQSKIAEWVGDDLLELQYFQKLAGLFLTGGNPEACLPLWIGPGGDGKSVITNTYRYILGDYAHTSTDTAFLDTRQSQHHEEIAWLVGARLVLVNEVNGSLPWNDARIKAVTGGESQSASYKGGHLFEFQPEFKLLITGNEAPSLRSVGPEFRRRFHLLKFARGVANPDPALSAKLKVEAGHILRWMIEGAAIYLREGLTPSPAVRAATAEYFEENDTIAQFLADNTVSAPDHAERGVLVYQAYQDWAKQQGFSYPLTRMKFSSRLKAKGIISKPHHYPDQENSVRCYIGIKLNKDVVFDKF